MTYQIKTYEVHYNRFFVEAVQVVQIEAQNEAEAEKKIKGDAFVEHIQFTKEVTTTENADVQLSTDVTTESIKIAETFEKELGEPVSVHLKENGDLWIYASYSACQKVHERYDTPKTMYSTIFERHCVPIYRYRQQFLNK